MNGQVLVQFCPCGHTCYLDEEEFIALAGGRRQLDKIEVGEKLDAPILPSEKCLQCQADAEQRLSEWLTDCALEEGVMVACPHCGENYWPEDGHPEGTLCPMFGNQGEPETRKEELPGDSGFYNCPVHHIRYWWEDVCPACEAEAAR